MPDLEPERVRPDQVQPQLHNSLGKTDASAAEVTRNVHGVEVEGIDLDGETRCAHWNSKLDIVALRFKCCGRWYSCFECHKDLADHPATVWTSEERNEMAVLCGSCGHKLTIEEYLNCDSKCTKCNASFNPGCSKHHDLYFE